MINESYNFNPSTPYAISRATTDTHLRKYFENFKLPIIFTRTANVYGPYQQIYRIVPKTLLFSRLNKKINLHGGGTSKRSFIYIDDASEATYKISLSGKTGDTYHISTEKIITIKNLVKKISHITKKNLSDLALINKDRIGKDYSYHLNIKKIKKELNWEAKVDLNSGLLKTLSWIDKNLNILKKEKFQYIHKK